MAKIGKWKSYHVKLSTLEEAAGVELISFRTMYPRGEEHISLRIPHNRWEYYGIKDALIKLGFTSQEVVYVNI